MNIRKIFMYLFNIDSTGLTSSIKYSSSIAPAKLRLYFIFLLALHIFDRL